MIPNFVSSHISVIKENELLKSMIEKSTKLGISDSTMKKISFEFPSSKILFAHFKKENVWYSVSTEHAESLQSFFYYTYKNEAKIIRSDIQLEWFYFDPDNLTSYRNNILIPVNIDSFEEKKSVENISENHTQSCCSKLCSAIKKLF